MHTSWVAKSIGTLVENLALSDANANSPGSSSGGAKRALKSLFPEEEPASKELAWPEGLARLAVKAAYRNLHSLSKLAIELLTLGTRADLESEFDFNRTCEALPGTLEWVGTAAHEPSTTLRAFFTHCLIGASDAAIRKESADCLEACVRHADTFGDQFLSAKAALCQVIFTSLEACGGFGGRVAEFFDLASWAYGFVGPRFLDTIGISPSW